MRICGVDEVGRGPWAGPVVACAVVLPADGVPAGIDDSKRLAPPVRERLARELEVCAEFAIGVATVEEIDRLNILNASLLAMQRAVAGLRRPPSLTLVDGDRAPALGLPTRCIVGGDASEPAIGAASIVAKVFRDRLMRELADTHPGYGWDRNVGYGTPEHRQALARLGPTLHHRRSFRPVRELAELLLTS